MNQKETYEAIYKPLYILYDLTDDICIQLFSLGEEYEKFTSGVKLADSIRMTKGPCKDVKLDSVRIKRMLVDSLKNCWKSLDNYCNTCSKITGEEDMCNKFRDDNLYPLAIDGITFTKEKPYLLTNEDIRNLMEFYDNAYNLAYMYGKAFRKPEYIEIVTTKNGDIYKNHKMNNLVKMRLLDDLTCSLYPDINKSMIELFNCINVMISNIPTNKELEFKSDKNHYSSEFKHIGGLSIEINK